MRGGSRTLLTSFVAIALLGCTANPPTPTPGASAGAPVSPGIMTPGASAAPVSPDVATPAPSVVSGTHISVSPTAALLTGAGQTVQLSAAATTADGQAVAVAWSSSDPGQVIVDDDGTVTAVAGVGSAIIFAEAGDDWASVAVLVAQPAAGALLIGDDQVVTRPGPLDATAPPGVGSRWRVTVTSVTAPAPGTVVLASGSTPLAGRVLTAGSSAAGTDIEYEVVPLPDLFERYQLALEVPFDVRDAADLGEPSSVGHDAVAHAFHVAGDGGITTAIVREEKKEAKFERGPLKCEASASAKFKSNAFTLTLSGKPVLQVSDVYEVPGDETTTRHTKVALTGPIAFDILGGLKGEAGFEGKAECQLVKYLYLPIGGIIAALLGIAIPVGVGASAEGKITAVEVELGPKVHIGATVTVGWECHGGTCTSIDELTPDANNEATFKSEVKVFTDMKVDLGVSLHLITGIAAVLFLEEYGIVDVKVGPKQALNLAFTDAQARDPAYASNYDLKFVANVSPGEALKKSIETFFGKGVTADLSFEGTSEPLAQSPTGTLTSEKPQVKINEPVRLSVDLDPASTDYYIIGPNVAQVSFGRRDAAGFVKEIGTADPVTSGPGQTHYEMTWTPSKDFLGVNDIVAFVVTKALPGVPLEIKADSVTQIEVVEACFDPSVGLVQLARVTAAEGCEPVGGLTWTSETTRTGEWGSNGAGSATVTLDVRLQPVDGDPSAFEDAGSSFTFEVSHDDTAYDVNGCFYRSTYSGSGGGTFADTEGASIHGLLTDEGLDITAAVPYTYLADVQLGGPGNCGQETNSGLPGEGSVTPHCGDAPLVGRPVGGMEFDMSCSWELANEAHTFRVSASGTVTLLDR